MSVTVSGPADAAVRLWLDDGRVSETTLDANGTGILSFRPTGVQIVRNANVYLAWVSGDDVGETLTVPMRSLL